MSESVGRAEATGREEKNAGLKNLEAKRQRRCRRAGARARLVYEVRGKVTAAAKKSAAGACEQSRLGWCLHLGDG